MADTRKPKPAVTRIGNHELSPATLMMGHGYDPVLSEGSLKAPIFLTSTFAFPSAADGKRFFEGITGKRPGGTDYRGYFFNAHAQRVERPLSAPLAFAKRALVRRFMARLLAE